jgi:hypothetical protein
LKGSREIFSSCSDEAFHDSGPSLAFLHNGNRRRTTEAIRTRHYQGTGGLKILNATGSLDADAFVQCSLHQEHILDRRSASGKTSGRFYKGRSRSFGK